MYQYKCHIVKIIDGDTIDIDIDLGFGIWLRNERIRLSGVDTPESRTSDLLEKVFGLAATEFVESILPIGSTQTVISTNYKSKFGRVLGDFILDNNELLSETIIKNYHGVPYNGESKEILMTKHLKNREYLISHQIVHL